MTKQPPAYTDRQLKTYDVLERTRMAWVVLHFLLGAFAVVLIAFLAGVFFVEMEFWVKGILGLLDGVLGWSIKTVVSFLFPQGKSTSPTPPVPIS